MTITYPLSLPSVSGLAQIAIHAINVVGSSPSPFTAQEQIYQHQGQWWEAEVTLPPMNRAEGEAWVAFLLSLLGRYGTFLMGEPTGVTARGIATGTPLVKGAAQTGQSLITDGWTISQTGILKAGDWLQLSSGANIHLHKVLQDVNSDSGGNATLDIWPRLRSAPGDNDPIVVSAAKGIWRLSSNDQVYNVRPGANIYQTFACREAI